MIVRLALGACAFFAIAAGIERAQAAELATAWNAGKPETKSRLLAGVAAGKAMAAVEIELADGWKTYWRFPGDAGGLPPSFDWSKSDNVASVKVLYPAPKRFTDAAGDTLGYKDRVIFPVEIEPKDATKPVTLVLAMDYGICRDVCIPVDSALTLPIPTGNIAPLAAAALASLEQVPRQTPRATDPKLIKTDVKFDATPPIIAIEAEFPGGVAKAEAYVESPSGYYIPLPKSGSAKDVGKDRLRFEIDLTGAVEPADIKGKTAIVTLLSSQGASQTAIKLD